MTATLSMLCLASGALAMQAADVAGVASWYGEEHRGKPMAWHGRPFNPDKLTAASYRWPLGAWVRVECGRRQVTVQITDRGPNHRLVGRVIDLSETAYKQIAKRKTGIVPVRVKRIK